MTVKLSICIPTYNRLALLGEAVESVLGQVNEGNRTRLEIAISDNASVDGTRPYVEKLQKEAPVPIVYNRNPENIGADRNYLKVVDLASGECCWLLGDDDRISPGAIDKMLEEIENNPDIDVFMGNKEDYNADFSHRMRFRPLFADNTDRIYDFSKEGLEPYFKASKKLICFFNYISSLVFKRNKWQLVSGKEKFIGTDYVHIYIIMAILWKGQPGKFKYVSDIIASRRWGTDRIPDIYRRLKLDIESYNAIASAVLTNPKLIRRINHLVIKNDGFSWAVRSRVNDGWGFYARSFPLIFYHFWTYPLFWFKMFPLLFTPASVLKLMRWSYRFFIKGEKIYPGSIFEG